MLQLLVKSNFNARSAVLCIASLGMLAVLLASCRAPRAPAPATPPPPSAGGEVLPAPAPADPKSMPARGSYRIDMADSELRVLVYRAGKLASLGHNHVMVNRKLSGSVESTGGADSSFSFSMPAATFVVDATQPRLEEGPDFSAEVSEEAKSGTLHNMLGEAALNAAHFPLVKVSSVGLINEQSGVLLVTLSIEVAGHKSTVTAPFTLASDYGRVIATGTVELKQSTLGLTPYSLALGALSVQDAMLVKFRIVANR
jgi:YceI-like domain